MNATQTRFVDAAIHASSLGDTDKAYVDQARSQLAEWRSEVVSDLMNYLRSNALLIERLEAKGINVDSLEPYALKWYDRLIGGAYGDDYWNDVWLLGLHALNADLEVSHIIEIGSHVSFTLNQRIFETYREGSAVLLAHAISSLISSSITVAAEAAYYELFACVQRAGITKPIIQRMIKIELNTQA